MTEEYLMALDAGTGAGRCFLISTDGRKAYSAYREWHFEPVPGNQMGLDFKPDYFWDVLAGVIQEAMHKAGITASQVVGVSSTSMREGCVFLDPEGKEVYAGPNRDYRAVAEGMQIAMMYGDEIYHQTGHYPSGLFAPARILWHKNNAPERYEQFTHLLMINDWILYRLSGEIACEPSNASETCLYNLSNAEWSWDIIEALELPKGIFPQILNSGTRLGSVTEQAAATTGLVAGTPVIVGGADTQCGLIGSGVIQDGQIAAISGTSTPVQLVTNVPVIDPDCRLWAGAHVVPGKFVLESNAGATGSIYQWMRDSFFENEIEKALETGISPYDLMNQQAAAIPPGSAGVMSFIGVGIFNARAMSMPVNMIDMGTAPFIPTASSKAMLTRAILESLAYAIKANFDQIVEVYGKEPHALTVCGGSTQSDLYLEILANVIQTRVQVSTLREGTSLGAAICAGVGTGVFSDFTDGVNKLVNLEKDVTPTEALSGQYEEAYNRWMKVRQSLLSIQS